MGSDFNCDNLCYGFLQHTRNSQLWQQVFLPSKLTDGPPKDISH